MKKLLSIFSIFLLVISLFNVCYAETELAPEPIPGGVSQTVTNAEYATDITIHDNQIPESSIDKITILDEEIPQGLPDTGGVPAELFYISGVVLIVIALIMTMKKAKV